AWARRRARALAVDGQRCAASRRAARGVGRRRTRTLTHNVLARIAVPKPHWLSLPSLDITQVYVTVGMRHKAPIAMLMPQAGCCGRVEERACAGMRTGREHLQQTTQSRYRRPPVGSPANPGQVLSLS